jgi:hypothetical protein
MAADHGDLTVGQRARHFQVLPFQCSISTFEPAEPTAHALAADAADTADSSPGML